MYVNKLLHCIVMLTDCDRRQSYCEKSTGVAYADYAIREEEFDLVSELDQSISGMFAIMSDIRDTTSNKNCFKHPKLVAMLLEAKIWLHHCYFFYRLDDTLR